MNDYIRERSASQVPRSDNKIGCSPTASETSLSPMDSGAQSRKVSCANMPTNNPGYNKDYQNILMSRRKDSCMHMSMNPQGSLFAPANQRRGSHHLRPFDTHWGLTKLSHSMEVVSVKPYIQAEDRKVRSFDTELGVSKASTATGTVTATNTSHPGQRKRGSHASPYYTRQTSSQSTLFHARSLTVSNSSEATPQHSSLEDPLVFGHPSRLTYSSPRQSTIEDQIPHPPTRSTYTPSPQNTATRPPNTEEPPPGLFPEEIHVYRFSPGKKQRSYQNIVETSSNIPSPQNYRARKSYVGEFSSTSSPQATAISTTTTNNVRKNLTASESISPPSFQARKMSHQQQQHQKRRERRLSSRNQSSQLSSRDSITINIIDSDLEEVDMNQFYRIHSNNSHNKSMINPSTNEGDDEGDGGYEEWCKRDNDKSQKTSISPRTAASKRRQFSRERQSLINPAEISEMQQKMQAKEALQSPQQQMPSQENKRLQLFERDYSIDERTNKIFNEFMREDPQLDKNVLEAQIREKIRRVPRKSNATSPSSQQRQRLENFKAASFAGKEETNRVDNYDIQMTKVQPQKSNRDESKQKDKKDVISNTGNSSNDLNLRRQSINRMKVQSFDHRIQLPLIVLPDDSP